MLKKTLAALAIGSALLSAGSAMAADYKIDKEGQHAFIDWKISHLGYSFIRRIDPPHKATAGERRFQMRAIVGRKHLLLQDIGDLAAGMFKRLGAAESHQLAVAPPVETVQVIVFTPLLQRGLAQRRQAQ